ncbi:MAG: hypothetical protein FWC77_04995 [Defluviitaleaceae bacterium]|nr:hypothetical protein [Defluviitaleaceae bacterium]
MENILTTTLRRAKSFLILALVALALYQAGRLWFIHLANRNFFEYVSARFVPSVPERGWEFVRPMRVVSGSGDGVFAMRYDGLMDVPFRTYFDTVMTEMFANGRFVSEAETDYRRVLSRPVLIYEYAFYMPGDVFPLGFNQRTTGFLTGRGVLEFNSVAIWPWVDGQDARVFFINNDRTWEFVLDAAREQLVFPIHPVPSSSIHFVSSILEGYEFLPPGSFVARSGDIGFSYFPVIVTNPYRPHIGGSLEHIRNQVSHFFDNPATINHRVAGDGVWTVSNIHTVVRYFGTDVLEYSSFRPRRRNITTSFLDDFSAAWAFILNDPHVIDENEVFLTGFEARGTGYVFWFGYIIDNFPILMPDNWEVSSPEDILPAPIEVVVEQGRVVQYRRLAHNFRLSDVHSWLDLDLDNFIEGAAGPLVGLSLGYHMSPWDSSLRLGWMGWYAEAYEDGLETEAYEGYLEPENP